MCPPRSSPGFRLRVFLQPHPSTYATVVSGCTSQKLDSKAGQGLEPAFFLDPGTRNCLQNPFLWYVPP